MLETYPQENMNTQAIRELTSEVSGVKQELNKTVNKVNSLNDTVEILQNNYKIVTGDVATDSSGEVNISGVSVLEYILIGGIARISGATVQQIGVGSNATYIKILNGDGTPVTSTSVAVILVFYKYATV